jgi:hypothetical protein
MGPVSYSASRDVRASRNILHITVPSPEPRSPASSFCWSPPSSEPLSPPGTIPGHVAMFAASSDLRRCPRPEAGPRHCNIKSSRCNPGQSGKNSCRPTEKVIGAQQSRLRVGATRVAKMTSGGRYCGIWGQLGLQGSWGSTKTMECVWKPEHHPLRPRRGLGERPMASVKGIGHRGGEPRPQDTASVFQLRIGRSPP